MRKFTLLLLIVIMSMSTFAQEIFQFKILPSFYFGYLLNPTDVNDYYAQEYYKYNSGFFIGGASDYSFNINIGLVSSIKFFNRYEFQPLLEYSISSQYLKATDHRFNFNKFSIGMVANYHIPFGSQRKKSFLIGAGLMYNSMSFENYSASAANPRFQVGISLNIKRFNPQVIICYDLANSIDEGDETFELDYTSIRWGINF